MSVYMSLSASLSPTPILIFRPLLTYIVWLLSVNLFGFAHFNESWILIFLNKQKYPKVCDIVSQNILLDTLIVLTKSEL